MIPPIFRNVSSRKSRDVQIEFRGLNQNLYVGENEFSSMKNMSSTHYPVLSPREKRSIYSGNSGTLNALHTAQGKLIHIDGTDFCYNGIPQGKVTEGKKQLVSIGAYVVIFPDKKLFNTASMEFEDLEASFTTTSGASYVLTNVDGDEYTVETISATAPSEPKNEEYWIDTSDLPHVLKQYSSASAMWVTVPTTYTKIRAAGIGTFFNQYDGVTISGSAIDYFNSDFVLQKVADDYIVVIGIIDAVTTQEEELTVERKVPDMDFICELNNRLWGCSSKNHEVYASKLGDPKNFYSYAGISTDSYALTIGSDGDFTGCISHLGYVLFFKEDVIHKVYGSKPSNFQLTDTHARGVEKGSEESLCIVNETLYYKSRDGICAYDGGLPTEVSQSLGITQYMNASAGTLGNKYYVSMCDTFGDYSLFVYDESKNLWHREDDIKAECFVRINGALYFVSDNKIIGVGETEELPTFTKTSEDAVDWNVVTGDILYFETHKKYISRINKKALLPAQSVFRVYVQYDNGEWEKVCEMNKASDGPHLLPIKTKRSDKIRLKLEGSGDAKVFAISKVIEVGSDI